MFIGCWSRLILTSTVSGVFSNSFRVFEKPTTTFASVSCIIWFNGSFFPSTHSSVSKLFLTILWLESKTIHLYPWTLISKLIKLLCLRLGGTVGLGQGFSP